MLCASPRQRANHRSSPSASPRTTSKQAVYLLQVEQQEELENLDDGQQRREVDSQPLREGKEKNVKFNA